MGLSTGEYFFSIGDLFSETETIKAVAFFKDFLLDHSFYFYIYIQSNLPDSQMKYFGDTNFYQNFERIAVIIYTHTGAYTRIPTHACC